MSPCKLMSNSCLSIWFPDFFDSHSWFGHLSHISKTNLICDLLVNNLLSLNVCLLMFELLDANPEEDNPVCSLEKHRDMFWSVKDPDTVDIV